MNGSANPSIKVPMPPEQRIKDFIERLTEARLYVEQGLTDGTRQIINAILEEIETEEIPVIDKKKIRMYAESLLATGGDQPMESGAAHNEYKQADPLQHYRYGLTLIEGHFFEEAIKELSLAVSLGVEPLKCFELCGDCALRLERWQEAFGFFHRVYCDEALQDDRKKSILAKIALCSQEQKKETAAISAAAQSDVSTVAKSELDNPSVVCLDSYMTDSPIGRTATSWTDQRGKSFAGVIHSYKVTGLLHIGSSSLVVELEDEVNGRRFAGHALAERLKDTIPVESLLVWTKEQMSINSRYLVRIYDLATLDGQFFIVREHLPLSLNDLLSKGSAIPLALAAKLAYQVLEALGDLHLHMASDGQIRNIFHLDLRPSRILLATPKLRIKIYNGGLWKEIEKASPTRAALRQLPLAHLCYRAPEQFRVYLARKRPPIFTDIYLFGVLLYEMLTGVPAFKASSYEEYEIQHCEQYPTPPRVWRSEIPEEINELTMNCLASDPFRRYRSTTRISLDLQKSFPLAASRAGDDIYLSYLRSLGL